MLPRFTVVALGVALAVWSASGRAQAQRNTPSGGTTTPHASGRIVAIGDVHADLAAFRSALRMAGAIDQSDAWVGGNLTVVQLGDLIGRYDEERQVLDFLFAMQGKARRAGGTLHALLGNHEIFGGRLDNQAVGRNPFPPWESVPGLRRDDTRLGFLPPFARARGAALMPGGPYAKKLADLPVVLKLGDTVFVHGGIVPRWAQYGVERINQEVRQWLLGMGPEPDSALGVDDGDRVMWTRQFSANVTETDCTLLDESLRILGARRMIVAHTVHPEVTPKCSEKVWVTDVGMSRAYGGKVQVLEIVGDRLLVLPR
jgi:hypothetical protein